MKGLLIGAGAAIVVGIGAVEFGGGHFGLDPGSANPVHDVSAAKIKENLSGVPGLNNILPANGATNETIPTVTHGTLVSRGVAQVLLKQLQADGGDGCPSVSKAVGLKINHTKKDAKGKITTTVTESALCLNFMNSRMDGNEVAISPYLPKDLTDLTRSCATTSNVPACRQMATRLIVYAQGIFHDKGWIESGQDVPVAIEWSPDGPSPADVHTITAASTPQKSGGN